MDTDAVAGTGAFAAAKTGMATVISADACATTVANDQP